MAQNLEWIREPARFAAVAKEWDRLAENDPTPFARHAWYSSWWDAFGDGSSMGACVLWRDEEMAAAFPLHERGRRLAAMANLHSPLFRPLSRDRDSLDAVVEAVLATGATELAVPAIPADDPALASLVEASGDAGRLSVVERQHTSPIVDITGDFDEYRSRLKSKLRPVERKARKLKREYDAELRILDPPPDFERELHLGFEVEASGWKGKAGTAVLSSPQTEKFYRAIARAFQKTGELTLSSLWLDGRLIAFSFGLLHQNRLYLLKTGYNESFSAVAPGMVLRLAIVERCFELGLQSYELLGDDTAWKRRFSTSRREHRAFYSYSPRPLPALRYSYRRLARPALKRARASLKARPT
jgi:CelD/BcsL family acetyltransferase involved in cellulose biosynthesis